MPRHHVPPDVAEPQDIEVEQLKRPKKRGSGTRKPAARAPRQRLHLPDIASPKSPSPTADFPPSIPEPLSTPALQLPLVASSTPLTAANNSPDISGTPAVHNGPPPAPISSDSADTPPSNLPTLSSANPTAPQAPNNPPGPGAESSPPGGVITIGGIDFHHASEAEFARLLNYYGIEWLYEPNHFPLQWRDGRPVEMFSPDFYLVEYDLYIELTTMRQSLVRRKNRKLRLLRALYPEINIKLLYRRDYHRILDRFGIKPEEIEAEMPFADDKGRSTT